MCSPDLHSGNCTAISTSVSARLAGQKPQLNAQEVLVTLRHAYPDLDLSLDSGIDGSRLLLNHTNVPLMPCHDPATSESTLDSASLCDQLRQHYTKGEAFGELNDAGRSRCDLFFRTAYGATAQEVQQHCVQVQWVDGSMMPMSTINHVNTHVEAIVRELRGYGDSLLPFLEHPGGSLNWRMVAGTHRLSPHAFGIAIDINVRHARYWKWGSGLVRKTPAKGTYRADIPWIIVTCFERHGFIWGGKWQHRDSMHFEYRPELCAPTCTCNTHTLRRPPGAG